eukprot:4527929-Heterocapsa_arctica.AAC.1
MRDEHDEALLCVAKADALWDEAKGKERSLRAGVAGTAESAGAGDLRADLAQKQLNDLIGL